MRKAAMFVLLVLLAGVAASCGNTKYSIVDLHHAKDYQWHKQTLYIRLHWNYRHPDKDTVVAGGYVEPFNQNNGVHTVRLELVGLDGKGNVVNSAPGRPKDDYLAHPLDESPFTISMKLNGRERRFTVRGTYFHYNAGEQPNFSSVNYDTIPTDDPEAR